MSKDKLSDYDSTTASNNADVGGISIAEGMLPSAVNNSIRELTKQLGAFADGTDGIDVLSLADDDASHAIKLQAPSEVTADTTFTLPDGDGTADQVLKTDGSGQLGWAAQTAVAPNPSLIINGAMQVAQRGTSDTFSDGDAGYKVADRWFIGEAGTESFAFDIAQSTDAPSGFAYSYKLDCTTADASLSSSSNASLEQRIEAQDLQQLNYGTSNAKSLTLSFWVKSSKTGTYIVWFFQDDALRSISAAYTIDTANTWEQKIVTIAGDASGQIDNNNGSGFRVRFMLFAGTDWTSGTLQTSWGASSNDADRYVGQVNLADSTSNEFYITGVKLEVGETATPFEHRSYGDELRKCQRYCYRPFVTSTTAEDAEFGFPRFYAALYSAGGFAHIEYPVTMRTNPILTYSVNGGTIDSDLSCYVKATLRDTNDTAFFVYNFQADAEL
jgi:hypothetical protein